MKNRFNKQQLVGLLSLLCGAFSTAPTLIRTVLTLFICLCFTNTMFSQSSVLKTTCPKITHIDTFMCNKSVLKVGDKELKPGGTYTVTLKASDGCDSILLINISTNISPSIIKSSTRFDIGYNTGLINVDRGNIYLRYTHQWNTGDTTPLLLNLKAGTYTDTITGIEGCKDTLVFIIDYVEPYEMPNAFSPNNDGLNDFFSPVANASYYTINFKIYNRLGNLVYNNETPTTGWDGKINGQDAPSDVYVYLIELDFKRGAPILKSTGEVILIR